MTYDQAEQVMAAVGERYPQREVVMVLKPRGSALELKSYGIQAGIEGGAISPEVLADYAQIAADAKIPGEEITAVDVQVTGTAAGLVVIFS